MGMSLTEKTTHNIKGEMHGFEYPVIIVPQGEKEIYNHVLPMTHLTTLPYEIDTED